jgi:hypothetical protein
VTHGVTGTGDEYVMADLREKEGGDDNRWRRSFREGWGKLRVRLPLAAWVVAGEDQI